MDDLLVVGKTHTLQNGSEPAHTRIRIKVVGIAARRLELNYNNNFTPIHSRNTKTIKARPKLAKLYRNLSPENPNTKLAQRRKGLRGTLGTSRRARGSPRCINSPLENSVGNASKRKSISTLGPRGALPWPEFTPRTQNTINKPRVVVSITKNIFCGQNSNRVIPHDARGRQIGL